MPKTHICSQGEYDGACFLYSITNAYKMLCGKRPTYKMWDKALEQVPFKEDFIVDTGTFRYDDNMELYVHAAERMLNEFSRSQFSLKVNPFPEVKSKKNLEGLINGNSILVFCIDGKHWVAAVDIDNEYIYLADSFRLITEGVKYCEKVSSKLKRHYNHVKKLAPFNWFYNPSALQIVAENA